ncbi:MAG TPA: hypothetical protein VFU41_03325 [Gemmatimonadales bacterium]|nr:hypothetical protein [Gemmatimonadales bacterium]
MLIDGHLRHYDVVERHRIAVAASREDTCRAMRETDFVRAIVPVARAVSEMRDVPRPIREVVHRVEHLAPDATFTLSEALAGNFALLGERQGRAIVIGTIGKLWKPHVEFLPLTPPEFGAFHEPKYAKLAIAFWVERFGRGKAVLRFEARVAATDDSARAHLRRWYRVVRPFTAFFMRRALANIKAEAETMAATPVA